MLRRTLVRAGLGIGLCTVAVLGAAVPSAWASADSFTVAGGPTGALTLVPGRPDGTVFTVVNTSGTAEQIVVKVTGLHFYGTLPQFDGNPSPGLSVTANPSVLALAPSASRDVSVQLLAAVGSKPGGLYAGIVFEAVPPSRRGVTTVAAAQARPLFGHVPGPTTDTGSILGFAPLHRSQPPGPATFQLLFADTGNIDYKATGAVALFAGGRQVGVVGMQPSTMLPGNTREVDITYSGTLAPGTVRAVLHLTWGTSEERHGTAATTLTVIGAGGSAPGAPSRAPLRARAPRAHTVHPVHAINWLFDGISLLLLLLVIAYGLWRYLRHRRERSSRSGTVGRPGPPLPAYAIPPEGVPAARAKPGRAQSGRDMAGTGAGGRRPRAGE